MSSYAVGQAIGHTIGIGALLIAPIAIGYWWAGRLTAKRDDYGKVRWPIATGFVISLLLLAGQCAAPKPGADTSTTGEPNG